MNTKKSFKNWSNQLLNEGNEWEKPMMELEEKVTARKIRQDKAKEQKELFLKNFTRQINEKMEVDEPEASTSEGINNHRKKISNKRKRNNNKISNNKKRKNK